MSEQSYMPKSEQVSIARKYKETKDLKYAEELFNENKNFAIHYALKSYNRYKTFNLELSELQNICLIGLWNGILNFDPDKDCSVIYYCRYHILDSIYSFLNKNMRVRIPPKKFNLALKINDEIDKFEEKNGFTPSLKHLSEKFNITDVEISTVLEALNIKYVNDAKDKDDQSILLDKFSFLNFDDESSTVMERRSDYAFLAKCINNLDEKESAIVKARFGIGNSKKTLGEVGAEFKLTKERIRQIQQSSVLKLRKMFKKESFA